MNITVSASNTISNISLEPKQSIQKEVKLLASGGIQVDVLDAHFVQTLWQGSMLYENRLIGSCFTYIDNNVYPVNLNSWTATLIGTAHECSSGKQAGTIYLTLASTALSGSNVVDVSNTKLQVPASIFTTNSPVGACFCAPEQARRVSLT